MKKPDLSKMFDNKTFTIVFSIVCAIICWCAVVFTISPDTTQTIRSVPVTINTSSAAYQSLGLDIIGAGEIYVSVEVTGPRTVVASLDKTDIVVTPSFSSVKGAGSYELQLTATKVNQLDNFSITSVNPGTVTLRFDNAVSKKLPVTADVVGLTVGEDYIAQPPVVSPAEVTVTGPEQELESVASAAVSVIVNDKVRETVKKTCVVQLFDAAGNEIKSPNLKLDNETVDVTVPVYKKGMLPLGIEFTNVPEGFDISTLQYTMSETQIPIAASETVINSLKTKIIGYVDLSTFEIGESYSFDVQLSSGVVNLDNVETVTVTFPKENIASKKVNVSDIRVVNAPDNMKVTVVNTRINDVTVIGQTEDVLSLLSGSVVAVVDMSTFTAEQGSYNVPVTFVVTANSTTFVSGSYSVLIEVEPAG